MGQVRAAVVDAAKYWNDTGIDLVKGREYEILATGRWSDSEHACGPEGWEGTATMRAFSSLKRVRPMPWFALVGSINRRKPYMHLHAGVLIAPASGRLYCFANDAYLFYWNNTGSVRLTVEEL